MKVFRFQLMGLALALSLSAWAQHRSGVDWSGADWMKHLPDNALVSQLSLPGAHDAATADGWASSLGKTYSTAQDVKMDVQYNAGVRVFDIRPSLSSNTLYNSHGTTRLNTTVKSTLDGMINFLNEHPTEFFIFHIYHGGNSWSQNAAKAFGNLLSSYGDRVVAFNKAMTVGDMRGKLLFLSREELNSGSWKGGFLRNWDEWGYVDYRGGYINANAMDSYGYNTSATSLYVQDYANPAGKENIARKIDSMTRLLDFTTHHTVTLPSQVVWTFNFASGYSNSGTSRSDGYRNNATYTNKAILDYLNDENYIPGPTGMIMADFLCVSTTTFNDNKYADNGNQVYGDELVEALIDNNFRCKPEQLVMHESGENHVISFSKTPDIRSNVDGDNGPGTNELMPMHRGYPIWGDWNGDGKMDIYYSGTSASTGWKSYGVLVNNQGGGNLTLSYRDNGLPPAAFMSGSQTLDYDQDGDLDFLCFNRGSNDTWHWDYYDGSFTSVGELLLVRNNGDGTFSVVPDETLRDVGFNRVEGVEWNQGRSITIMSIADYDRDGYPDLVLQGRGTDDESAFVKVLHNKQGQGFELGQNIEVRLWSGGLSMTDLNADGWPDIAMTGWGGTTGGAEIHFYRGTGMQNTPFVEITDDVALASGWHQSFDMHRAWGAHEAGLLCMDYDQDGRMDVYVNGSSGDGNNKLSVALINETEPGSDTFKFRKVSSGLTPFSVSSDRMFFFVDLNGDDIVDGLQQGWTSEVRDWRFSVSESCGKWNTYDNHYFGGEEEGNNLLGGTWQDAGSISLGDFNGDGGLDMAAIGYTGRGEQTEIFYNTSAVKVSDAPAVPGNVSALNDGHGNITVSWDASKLSKSNGAPLYNIVLIDAATNKIVRSLVPAVRATGAQLGYSPFSAYFVSPESRPSFQFANVPAGKYTVGVQAVNYGYRASEFAVTEIMPDVCIDGQTSIADVITLINVLLGNATGNEGVTDIDGDGDVDTSDVTTLVNLLLGK